MAIPKIIHQVWEGKKEPKIPIRLRILADTWKEKNPSWEYHLWNADEMDELVRTYFPEFLMIYQSFKYDVQRWDAIRYMILYHYGGVYADLDSECFRSIDSIVENYDVFFVQEPKEHVLQGYPFVGNAIMGSASFEKVWLDILGKIQDNVKLYNSNSLKNVYVLQTTGPLMISEVIHSNRNYLNRYVLPLVHTTPVSKQDLVRYLRDGINDFEKKLENVYFAHYFFGSWEKKLSLYKTPYL